MRSCPTRRREDGFTLVELLVALVIFGMLSAAGVALLSFSVRSQEVSDAAIADLSALRRTDALLQSDLGQVVARLPRDEAGARQPAFRGGTGEDGYAFTFVRRGWENVRGAKRASLQKVEYALAGGRLVRRAWPHVDGAQPMPPVVLLEGITGMRLRYRDIAGGWRDRWDPAAPNDLPRAVELVMTLNGREVRQLFLTGALA